MHINQGLYFKVYWHYTNSLPLWRDGQHKVCGLTDCRWCTKSERDKERKK